MGNDPAIERRRSWNMELRQRFRHLEEHWNRAHSTESVEPPSTSSSWDDRDEWTGLGISVHERHVLKTARPNVLLIGSDPAVTCVLQKLELVCLQPFVSFDSPSLRLPTGPVGTLALLHVERLGPVDQRRLYAWLSCAVPRQQVITTASVPLFPSVVSGTFYDALFYRLNEVSLMVREVPGTQRARKLASARSAGALPDENLASCSKR